MIQWVATLDYLRKFLFLAFEDYYEKTESPDDFPGFNRNSLRPQRHHERVKDIGLTQLVCTRANQKYKI